MRLLGINDYEQANQYLPEFIRDYNRRFVVVPVSNLDCHHPLDETLDLDFLFSIHAFRIITQTLLIHFTGKVYQIVTKHSAYYYAKQEVLIACDPSWAISAWYHVNLLTLDEIEKRPKQRTIVFPKSAEAKPLPPAHDHHCRIYGKKINGKPKPTNLSTE